MASFTDVYHHSAFRSRLERQFRSLLTMDRMEMARYAAESYAYWSLRALLAEQEYADLVIELKRGSRGAL